MPIVLYTTEHEAAISSQNSTHLHICTHAQCASQREQVVTTQLLFCALAVIEGLGTMLKLTVCYITPHMYGEHTRQWLGYVNHYVNVNSKPVMDIYWYILHFYFYSNR